MFDLPLDLDLASASGYWKTMSCLPFVCWAFLSLLVVTSWMITDNPVNLAFGLDLGLDLDLGATFLLSFACFNVHWLNLEPMEIRFMRCKGMNQTMSLKNLGKLIIRSSSRLSILFIFTLIISSTINTFRRCCWICQNQEIFIWCY